MYISVENIGKKYNKNWVFRNVDLGLDPGEKVAITGRNGSGKSTLLKIIGGYIAPTEGRILHAENINFQIHFSLAAPYQNLIEEFTLAEHLTFHSRFKRPLLPIEEMISKCGLEGASKKYVAEFSSGMKQRLRLAMAFFYESEAILLDEPTSNLDAQGIKMYLGLVEDFSHSRSLIIASNQPEEYQLCDKLLKIENS